MEAIRNIMRFISNKAAESAKVIAKKISIATINGPIITLVGLSLEKLWMAHMRHVLGRDISYPYGPIVNEPLLQAHYLALLEAASWSTWGSTNHLLRPRDADDSLAFLALFLPFVFSSKEPNAENYYTHSITLSLDCRFWMKLKDTSGDLLEVTIQNHPGVKNFNVESSPLELKNPFVFRIMLQPGWDWATKKVSGFKSESGFDVYHLVVVQRQRRAVAIAIDQPADPQDAPLVVRGEAPGLPRPPFRVMPPALATVPMPSSQASQDVSSSQGSQDDLEVNFDGL